MRSSAIPARRAWSRAALRPGDRFIACEKHPEEALLLKREFAGDRAVEVRQADGYHAIKSTLPPVERRALVLIDPPFEATDEFEVLDARGSARTAPLRDRLLCGLVPGQGRARRWRRSSSRWPR